MKGRDVIKTLEAGEGKYFLSYAWGLSFSELALNLDRDLSEEEEIRFRKLLEDREKGRPLQYCLGMWDFYGRTFKVDERALIPRPETERLVEEVLKRGIEGRILVDVGTGSGVIALSLAMESLESGRMPKKLFGTDISKEALDLARENEKLFSRDKMVQWTMGDLLDPIDQKVDWIVSNPPYIDYAEKAGLQRELEYEPQQALFAEDKGLAVYKRLIEEAICHLNDGGRIGLEIGQDQAKDIKSMLEAKSFENIEVVRDYNDRDRMIFAEWKTRGGFCV